jgi:hypothetical protein
MQWEARATRSGGTAIVVLGADDRGGDIMEVLRTRLPPGEWDVTARPAGREAAVHMEDRDTGLPRMGG